MNIMQEWKILCLDTQTNAKPPTNNTPNPGSFARHLGHLKEGPKH